MSKKPEQNINTALNAGTYETQDFEQANASVYTPLNEPLYLINEGHLTSILSNIQGKFLTLIEASTDDREKRESLKSLARQVVWQDKIYLLRLKKVK